MHAAIKEDYILLGLDVKNSTPKALAILAYLCVSFDLALPILQTVATTIRSLANEDARSISAPLSHVL
jgi:hypothetical protein